MRTSSGSDPAFTYDVAQAIVERGIWFERTAGNL